jgi:UDP-N-acetyl-D-mannosaminuronic acid dehydrogenase
MVDNSICILGGCGHVGLPLATAFAVKGAKVSIYDIDKRAVDMVNKGELPFHEDNLKEILQSVIGKNLIATDNIEIIKDSKFLLIIIGTPVDEHLNPKMDLIDVTIDQIKPYLQEGQIIILRSTLYPGTTQLVKKKLESEDMNIEVCFCPERIAEGRAMEELFTLPQIVSGFNKESIQWVVNLFKLLTNDIIETNPLEAELIKLFTNSWRYISFAVANQFFMIAEEYQVNFYKIYDAMKYKYPRTRDFPKPGFAAGPCLFKDTMQLSAYTNNKFFLGHSSMLINEGLPNFILTQLLNKYDLHKMNVGILGMAYKAESDDPRESLSYKLKKVFKLVAKEVICSDVYIKNKSFVSEEELLDRSDIIIIGSPHNKYVSLDYKGKIVYDIWNIREKQS